MKKHIYKSITEVSIGDKILFADKKFVFEIPVGNKKTRRFKPITLGQNKIDFIKEFGKKDSNSDRIILGDTYHNSPLEVIKINPKSVVIEFETLELDSNSILKKIARLPFKKHNLEYRVITK